MKRIVTLHSLVLAAALALSACGSSDSYLFLSALQSGTPQPLNFSGDKTVIHLDTPQGNENYLLILASTRASGDRQSLSLEIADGSSGAATSKTAAAAPVPVEPWAAEAALLAKRLPPLPRAQFRQDAKTLPYFKEFRLLSDFSHTDRYQTIQAKLLALSGQSAIYLDDNTAADLKTHPEMQIAIDTLQKKFDEQILPVDRQYFGEVPDVDGFTPIQLLISPSLNQLGAEGARVRGFFFAGDLYPRSEPDNPASNQSEVLYLAAPNPAEYPAGTDLGQVIRRSFANTISATVAHELQHLINFNQRVLRLGKEAEQPWLNEGLSHLAEELNGYFSANDGRATQYLRSTSSTSLTSGADSLAQRGGSYLLLRYLLNQNPDGLSLSTRALVTGEASGVEKLARVFKLPFEQIMADFSLALWYEDATTSQLYSLGPRPVAPQTVDAVMTTLHYARPSAAAVQAGALPFLPSQINYLHLAAHTASYVELTVSGEAHQHLTGFLLRLPDGRAGSLQALEAE